MSKQHAFFLTADGRALSATCFVPDTVRGAVLCVPPLVEERKGALPAFVQTARALAAQGFATLLVDLRGCGDSDGAFEEQDPEGFERDCDAAGRGWPFDSRTSRARRSGCAAARCWRCVWRRAVPTCPPACCGHRSPDLISSANSCNDAWSTTWWLTARRGKGAPTWIPPARRRMRDLDGYTVTGALYAGCTR
jgi:pimeloyl-ACP methyl ester carboxylesterase